MLKINFSAIFLIIFLVFGKQFVKPSFIKNPSSIIEESNFVNQKQVWVDSIYDSMSEDEKIGQLFMVAAYSNKDESHYKAVDLLVSKYNVGGIIFFQGGPMRQAKLTNRFQAESKVPLFIGIDAEWGLSMRLDSTYRYPWNMTLGAIKDHSLIEKMGEQMASQSKRMGIHFTFGPVVDINTNPNNPIIGNRSFGESRENVTKCALAYMNGLQKNGVFATAKHFPGHGDTSTDSHHTLPSVSFTKERINSIELYPYKELIKNNLASIMVAHLSVPALEPEQNIPSSISSKVVTDLLKNEFKFNGLIFTDALNMKGASNFKKPGEIDLAAFIAGNDILLFAENVPVAIEKFKDALRNGKITEERLSYSVKKILSYKFESGLNKYKPIDYTNLYNDLNKVEFDALNHKLYENAITTLINKDNCIPIQKIENEKIAYIKLGEADNTEFTKFLNNYTKVDIFDSSNLDKSLVELKKYTKVIIGYHKEDGAWKNHSLTFKELLWIEKVSKQNKTILCLFTKPYSLNKIKKFDNLYGLVLAYQNNKFTQSIVPQILFGATSSLGKLPVSIGDFFHTNDGIKTNEIKRLGYNFPENLNMDSKKLEKIDSIVNYAIKKKMTPGAQVIVARKGMIIYNKSFGNHDYENQIAVNDDDLYDIASLTKILSTLPNVMQQFEKGNINFSTTLAEMLPEFKESNKENVLLIDMLTHQARLQPWIPFYQATLDSLKKPKKDLYAKEYSVDYPIKVANELYLRKGYNDSIIKTIRNSELLAKKQYKYSDFSFILLKEYLERQSNQSLDVLSENHFYKKIGATTLTYNPLNKFLLFVDI